MAEPLFIRNLEVRESPGFRSGLPGFEEDFCGGINLISGPNAAGKSTLAEALQRMLFSGPVPRWQLSGTFWAEQTAWRVSLSSREVHFIRNGEKAAFAHGLPASAAGRYLLSLHELIRADDRDLSAEIRKQMIGGYDPDAALAALKYESVRPPRSIAEHSAFQAATQNLGAKRRQDQELRGKAAQLEALHRQLAEAERAQAQLAFLALLAGWRMAETAAEAARRQLTDFPPIPAAMRGDHADTLRQLKEGIREAAREREDAQRQLDRYRIALKELGLPEAGISRVLTDGLDSRLQQLSDLGHEQTSAQNTEKEAQAACARLRQQLDPGISEAQLRAFKAGDAARLGECCRRRSSLLMRNAQLRAQVNELEAQIEKISGSEDGGPQEKEVLQSGVRALSDWLAEQRTEPGIPALWLWLLTGAGAVSVLLSVLADWGWLSALLIPILLLLGLRAARSQKDEALSLRQADFQKTGLSFSGEWVSGDVLPNLNRLLKQLETQVRLDAVIQQKQTLAGQLSTLENQLQRQEPEMDELRAQLGTLPDIAQLREEPDAVFVLVSQLQAWQQADVSLEQARARITLNQDQQAQVRRDMHRLMKPFLPDFPEPPADLPEAQARFKALRRKAEDWRDKQQQIDNTTQQLQSISRSLTELQHRKDALLTELGLGQVAEDEQLVFVWDEVLPAFREAQGEVRDREQDARREKERVMQHALFPASGEAVFTLSEAEIEREQAALSDAPERYRQLSREITQTETLIQQARRAHSLEDALAAQAEAAEALRERYRASLKAAVGQALVEQLKARISRDNVPEVLQRARKYFADITQGRYELVSGEAFSAFDVQDNALRSLDELSSGTRIQLLLAVRLAWIETQEGERRFPLFCDELLANSDDLRAQAIIRALAAISAQGWQVFYFTAQGDEVAKWEQILGELPESDRPEIRHFRMKAGVGETTVPAGQPFTPLTLPEVPSAEGHSRESYAEAVQAPRLNPLTQEVAQLHIAWLMTKPEQTEQLLRLGIRVWGQLSAQLEHPAVRALLSGETRKRLRQRMQLLSYAIAQWRTGRNQPVFADDLEASGAVSDTFLPRVLELLESEHCQNDPERLIAALRSGEVSGFRSGKTDELEAWLTGQGKISAQEPLPEEELRSRILLYAKEHGMEDGILGVVWDGVGERL
ncbi:Uncharacterized protein YhaN [Cyclonatronum proteinivorum]|uniref:Uncharacterized protein YhaN n=1 Tax=Cyclonatronum proteinivorum TaxID=1457365 RepID=A0A345UNW0_9BACT|nr:AAA family ATPase [Cyclonatronum proteinivorum]AXJ02162.1 Uncharacterized protein YhaN [Cyclonatronum proteinivorum]